MRRAVIVDDEPKSIEVFKTLVENFIEGVEIIGSASDIVSAIELIERCKPDIAFLDIALKEGDSFQILKQLKTIDFDVVFITAYDEYTTRALRYSGIHCLYKPIDIAELEKTLTHLKIRSAQASESIEIARQLIQSKFSHIPLITPKGLKYISPDQINYMETFEEGSQIFFTDSSSLATNKTLPELSAVMENTAMVTIKTGLLINLKNIVIEKTQPNKICFQSGVDLKLETEEVNTLLRMMGKGDGL